MPSESELRERLVVYRREQIKSGLRRIVPIAILTMVVTALISFILGRQAFVELKLKYEVGLGGPLTAPALQKPVFGQSRNLGKKRSLRKSPNANQIAAPVDCRTR